MTILKGVNRQRNKKIMPKLVCGFTIIETMISVSIFTIIIMAGMGSLLSANALHQKSQNMRSILDSMSFMLEDMSRNLRTGYHYRCYDNISPWSQTYAQSSSLNTPQSCANGWVLVFEGSNGKTPLTPAPNADPDATDQWAYLIGNYNGKDGVFKSTHGGGTLDAPDWVQLTPDEVGIDLVVSGFTVLGAEPPSSGDQQQPFVVIRLVGNINFKGIDTPFSLQTSVSQRGIDR